MSDSLTLSLDFSTASAKGAPGFEGAPMPSSERRIKPVHQAFSGEISAGKNTYVYDAHTYHTKVPPQGIAVLIEHYTQPGDTVLDPFCGSGMTGIMFVSDNAVGYDLVLHCRKCEIDQRRVVDAPVGDAVQFIRAALGQGEYVSHYLHVRREDEFNVRKLYSEWLAVCLPKRLAPMDFEQFRKEAERIRSEVAA